MHFWESFKWHFSAVIINSLPSVCQQPLKYSHTSDRHHTYTIPAMQTDATLQYASSVATELQCITDLIWHAQLSVSFEQECMNFQAISPVVLTDIHLYTRWNLACNYRRGHLHWVTCSETLLGTSGPLQLPLSDLRLIFRQNMHNNVYLNGLCIMLWFTCFQWYKKEGYLSPVNSIKCLSVPQL